MLPRSTTSIEIEREKHRFIKKLAEEMQKPVREVLDYIINTFIEDHGNNLKFSN